MNKYLQVVTSFIQRLRGNQLFLLPDKKPQLQTTDLKYSETEIAHLIWINDSLRLFALDNHVIYIYS